ncbi:hypothetical protein SEUCBS139899_002796 [Sporothrix eucalyptigena]|uniref:Uncharacterized protein n=1 Tax=Sporothrix eucalyptigena TaxID=1812306 RepID=A0ABP0CG18_9PEZI
MPTYTITVPEACSFGTALYSLPPKAAQHRIFAYLLFLLEIARATTQCECEHGVVSMAQQDQRLTLELLVHLVGTGIVDGSENLLHRMWLHMDRLHTRLRSVNHQFQSLGGDVAYIRSQWRVDNMWGKGRDNRFFKAATPEKKALLPFTLLNVARGLSIFHHVEGIKAQCPDLDDDQLLLLLWADICEVYAPLVGVTARKMMTDRPEDMEDLLLRYFELAKRPAVVAGLTAALRKDMRATSP